MARGIQARGAFALALLLAIPAAAAGAPLAMVDPTNSTEAIFDQAMRSPDADQSELSPELRRQVVAYPTRETPGTVVIDTPNHFLYLVLGNGRALRYGIGVGREGFTWSGVQTVSRKAEWPEWIPPAAMIARQPYLPRWVGGGPGNPLGARAMYLGNTEYRIHGTNDPTTIGKNVSSGCIRLTNDDVIDLYSRLNIGTKVAVLPAAGRRPVAHSARTKTTAALTTAAPRHLPAVRSRLPDGASAYGFSGPSGLY
jgi:lipoprotein-anchoring transpeptidase ErfK/SrfK